MKTKRLSEDELENLKEYIFERQRKYFKKKDLRIIKKMRNGYLRKESYKMLYSDFVLIDDSPLSGD